MKKHKVIKTYRVTVNEGTDQEACLTFNTIHIVEARDDEHLEDIACNLDDPTIKLEYEDTLYDEINTCL